MFWSKADIYGSQSWLCIWNTGRVLKGYRCFISVIDLENYDFLRCILGIWLFKKAVVLAWFHLPCLPAYLTSTFVIMFLCHQLWPFRWITPTLANPHMLEKLVLCHTSKSDLRNSVYFREKLLKGATESLSDGSVSTMMVMQNQGPEFGP